MKTNRRRKGFTLIEVLIVVVIMALLAAVIIPQFAESTGDAKKSALQFNVHTMRAQIELYKMQHNGTPPALAKFEDQMTKKTNADGTTTGTPTLGPYVNGEIPVNPYNNSKALVAVATPGATPSAVADSSSGWQYDESNGGFFANNSEAFN